MGAIGQNFGVTEIQTAHYAVGRTSSARKPPSGAVPSVRLPP